jgi:hypothetical protein
VEVRRLRKRRLEFDGLPGPTILEPVMHVDVAAAKAERGQEAVEEV